MSVQDPVGVLQREPAALRQPQPQAAATLAPVHSLPVDWIKKFSQDALQLIATKLAAPTAATSVAQPEHLKEQPPRKN